ncbi:TetR family transcriptional regulator C-terminal domain-containing protein [Microbacterium sp. ARD31]|uniref:TetR/AcrR family transcriptional regulator n=1 Tax=Microbacterium sp. ARD31 TaxID=2962576 RepID=UPI0028827CB7|nr:TetR family transcriptional regulator C-terminal domain-containing protein [Microbacterium sp. ARD31]MDT0184587.1 TetR family transcriptional regulator C-terminal domain-containing protein [Microbacterium sp. ARD31]
MSRADEELTPRRREILAAATTVLAQQGNRGLTHRAVDREAGLPEGSSSAYYRSRSALLGALGDFVADRLAADVEALGGRLATCPGDHERAVAEVSRLFSRWLDQPDLLAARLELTVAATRDPELAQRFALWRDDLVAMVDAVLAGAGKDGGASAQTLVAALDGVLLASLLLPPRRRRTFVGESVEQLLSGLGQTTS